MEKKFFQKPTTYVGEVNINVTDLERSLHFYKNILGFRVLKQSSLSVVLTADGKTPILSLEQPPEVISREAKTTGLYHFAILLPTRADLSSFLKHSIRSGVPLGASDHYVSEALYFNDPDGNGIEVYRDRPSSEWNWTEGQVAMATEPLDGDNLLAEGDKEWNGMPEDTILGHIHLHVANLEETEKFYVNGLGFKIVTKYPGALFASTGDYHHHIGLNVWNGVGAKPPVKNSVGLNWFELVFPSEEAVKQTVSKLNSMGVTVKHDNEVVDPAGNVIRLVC
ncbi:VOC family protein [Ornithinibacillus salinisoli]|uniref:VOC family protein n=1 Tax=Ornithinibacillus salinisoli TaxID=1848459 RepID=A0ABW4VWZ7_9BACI